MELVTDANGNAASRLNDLVLTAEQAREYHCTLIRQVVRMLRVGVVHCDLSEYNVLADSDGLVIIDLPQAVDAAGNSSAAVCSCATWTTWPRTLAALLQNCLSPITAGQPLETRIEHDAAVRQFATFSCF